MSGHVLWAFVAGFTVGALSALVVFCWLLGTYNVEREP